MSGGRSLMWTQVAWQVRYGHLIGEHDPFGLDFVVHKGALVCLTVRPDGSAFEGTSGEQTAGTGVTQKF